MDAGIKGMKEMCMNMLMEAEEKCEEIDVKCEEEYSSLKLKEIIEQRSKVKKIMEKRQAEIEKENRVYMTKLYNHSRLEQLKAKNDIVKQIMDEVKLKLSKERGHNYVKLLKHSMIQALFMLMEPEVKVVCKKNDRDVVADCFREVAKAYERKTLLHTKIFIAQESLPDKNVGGLIVCSGTDQVSVDCLLESRVEQVCRQAMPLIVDLLFADVKIAEVVKDTLVSTSTDNSISAAKGSEQKALIRMTRSPLPPREEGVTSSTIALPISPSSSGSIELEPTATQASGARPSRRQSTESLESATPSPTRAALSNTPTPSPSPPRPPEPNGKNPKQQKK